MPTYQYACTNPECGNRFELVQSFTDPNASECPVCGSNVRKVFSAVGVVFKGSGFYRTDSRAGSSASLSSSSDSGSSSSSSSSDSGSSGSGSSGSGSSGSGSSGSGSSGSGSSGAASAAS
ncbi:FmdB family zinc ribbon protein [Jatrophihabitans sp.]|uniref:FmdB family zinc ribbon protein n=1 Tax=Jatrophihabitans sp. TaxID=1932789 RepID=UPI0030C68E92|nr:regulatory protein FmdB family [Jatrophihabitans sp.]